MAGGDYQAVGGTLTFGPGLTNQTITVPVNGDIKLEPDETFLINLSSPVNAIISDGQAVGTIRNDETGARSSASRLSAQFLPLIFKK